MEDPIEYLRMNVTVRSAEEAAAFLASHSRQRMPGSASLVFLDQDRRFSDLLLVEDGAEHLRELLWLTCSPGEPDVTALFVATDRTGEIPADRPDDELTWLELRDVARGGDVELLDWFVLWGDKAFSVAEHAPAAAAW